MQVIIIGIVVAILLFKIYPSKTKNNNVKKRSVQTILIFALLVALVIVFKTSIMMMKFVSGIAIGVIGLYFAFKKRKRQIDNVTSTVSTIDKILSSRNKNLD